MPLCDGTIFRGESMPNDTLPWALQKRLNQSRCCLGCGLGCANGTMYIRWGPDPLCEVTIFRGKNMPSRVWRRSAMNCANVAEQIEMPFGWRTLVDPRKHVLHGVHIGATWWIRLNSPCSGGPNEVAAMRPYVELLWLLVLSVSKTSCSRIFKGMFWNPDRGWSNAYTTLHEFVLHLGSVLCWPVFQDILGMPASQRATGYLASITYFGVLTFTR